MKRIDFLANLLKNSNVVLDIGTDHGLVLKKAFDNKYITKGLASDINAGPLSAAKKNLADYDVSFYLSDGFKSIQDKSYDTVLITGMGAQLITEILDGSTKDCKYILQANEKNEILREYLMSNGFKIVDEHVVYDGFYYVIIECVLGIMELSKEDLYLGPILKTKLSSREYYINKIETINKFIDKTDAVSKKNYQNILRYYKKYI